MLGEEIVMKIDETLDQLIRNAEAIQTIDLQELSEMEIAAFQKTQESLLHRFLHMDELLEAKRKNLHVQDKRSASYKIREKLRRFEHLKSKYTKALSEHTSKTLIVSKRRHKRLLSLV